MPLTRSTASNHFENGMARPGAEVEARRSTSTPQVLERLHVGDGEILNVDVVTDAGAVGRVVVVAENGEMVALSHRGFAGDRDQMGLGAVVFPEVAFFVRACGVEVAQVDVANAPRDFEILKSPLEDELRRP